MVGKRWTFVKKTFNVLGMAKAAQPKSGNINDNDESHSSDVELEIRKPSSQPITLEEHAQSKKRTLRRKKKDPKVAAKKEKAAKAKSIIKTEEEESEALARARARREELQQFKKRTEEDIFLCKTLGMDTDGMCLRHPNQPITNLGSTFEEVHRCRICDSESQMGSKAPRQRKSMANVIDQVKAMQANREDWRKRTKVMFWTSKQGLDFDSDDDQALDDQLALTKEEWEEQVSARVTQVVAWRDENQLQAHPIFCRYFKMLDMGVPMEAAKNACQMDGYNPIVLDLDPAKPLKSQLGKLDKATKAELEALIATENGGEETLDVPELVTRVSASFHKQMARDMLEAVQTLDALSEKTKKKKKSKRDSSKSLKSKPRSSTSKERKKEASTNDTSGDTTLQSPKKKKSKRDSTKKDQKSTTKRESIEPSDASKKKKTRRSTRKSSSSTKGSSEDGTMGDSAAQAKIAELNLALEEKDKEIESLKQQLRQKDTIIQNLSKRTNTAVRQKSNEFESPTRPSMGSSEHAVIAPMSDDDDEATNDALQVHDVEYQLPGYDFKTGDTNGENGGKDEILVHDYAVPLKAERKGHGEHDGDESIDSDAGAVPDVSDDANVGHDDDHDDDDTSSASDLITTEDDLKIWRLGGDPSNHEVKPEQEKLDAKPKDGNAEDGIEKNPQVDSSEDNNNAAKQVSEDSDSGSEDGQDEDDSSNGSHGESDSDNDEKDDDEEEVWLSDLEGEGTERSNDSDASDEEEP